MSKSSSNRFGGRLLASAGTMFAVIGAAGAAAAALDGGRRPQDRDLRVLGIDPAGFDTIRRS